MAPFMISVLRRNAPLVTTRWPGFKPQVTSTTSLRSVGRRHPLRPVSTFPLREEHQVGIVFPLDGVFRDHHGVMPVPI